ncbi:GHKL domain-containing protein [Pedobacter hiemivivus]|uniref:histidine kinase n=1 Tax=Pedobacter hiemivivus TaxID=2530454 RepID=A0A4U1GBG4_9SPHI|nr:sensor histidine kinase [Pedobacter hiemivivus]TKC58462.1 GHKL domain-containing protein [Pedobacter hiemivivus]
MLMRYSLFLLICLASICKLYSQPLLHLDDGFPYQNIGKSISYLEDKAGKLTLNEARAMHQAGKFRPSDKEILNLGNTTSAFWLKIDYINKSKGKAFLVIDVPNIEHIDLYEELQGGKLLHLQAGSLSAATKGVVVSNNFVFNLLASTIDPKPQSIYLRVKTNNVLLLPIKLASSESLIENGTGKVRFEAMYIGAIIILFFFNLFLYLSFKDHIYFIYSIYVGMLFIYLVFFIRGYGYVFGQDFRSFINLYPHVFLSISCLASAYFSISFLELKKRLPKALFVYNILIVCWLLILVMSALGYKNMISALVNYLLMLSGLFLWAVAFWSYLKGHKPALYYIMAWAFVCVPILFITLSLSNVFAYGDYTFYVVPVGTTIELLLLSFALGDRFNTIRKYNMLLVTTQKERLEKLVHGRTLKLHDSVKMLKEKTLKLNETIETLEETNAIKNKLFSIIAHDLRSPFNSLLSIFSLKDMDLLTFEDLKMLLNESRRSIDTIHNTLNNLLYWAKSQMDGAMVFPTRFDLLTLVNDLILVYQPLIERKSINILLKADSDLMVHADENQVQLIMRNLIDNAIKFTPFGQCITINLKKDESNVHICVINEVAGSDRLNVTSFNAGKIQTPAYGTANEKGVGLGLHLCREYIIQNGGELKIGLHPDKVSLCFNLSSAQ